MNPPFSYCPHLSNSIKLILEKKKKKKQNLKKDRLAALPLGWVALELAAGRCGPPDDSDIGSLPRHVTSIATSISNLTSSSCRFQHKQADSDGPSPRYKARTLRTDSEGEWED